MHAVVLILVVLRLVCMVYILFVFALGRTYIDGSLSCLYGVPLVHAHGRTYIDGSLSCLYGVPLVYAHGRTYIDDTCVVTWCTVSVLNTHSCACYFGILTMHVCCSLGVHVFSTPPHLRHFVAVVVHTVFIRSAILSYHFVHI